MARLSPDSTGLGRLKGTPLDNGWPYKVITELEQQLTTALTALSKQYEAEMEQQAEWVGGLQEQVQRLEEAVKDLKPQLGRTEALAEDLKRQVESLAADYKEITDSARGVSVWSSVLLSEAHGRIKEYSVNETAQ